MSIRTKIIFVLAFVASFTITTAVRGCPSGHKAETRQYTEGLQWYTVMLDGASYRLEFRLPPGKWHGAYRLGDVAALGFDQGSRALRVAVGPMKDFDSELGDMRGIAERAPHGAELVVVTPGHRAELHGRSEAEDGSLLRSRMVTVRPDAGLPIGVSVLDQSPLSEPEPDLEEMLSSIRLTRE